MGPSGGLDGGAGMVWLGWTSVDEEVEGESCGRRLGWTGSGSMPGKA